MAAKKNGRLIICLYQVLNMDLTEVADRIVIVVSASYAKLIRFWVDPGPNISKKRRFRCSVGSFEMLEHWGSRSCSVLKRKVFGQTQQVRNSHLEGNMLYVSLAFCRRYVLRRCVHFRAFYWLLNHGGLSIFNPFNHSGTRNCVEYVTGVRLLVCLS